MPEYNGATTMDYSTLRPVGEISSAGILSIANGINLPKPLARFYAALSARNTVSCNVFFAGSSTTQGSSASTIDNAYFSILVRRLQGLFPSNTGLESVVYQNENADFDIQYSKGVHGYSAGQGGTTASSYLTDEEIDKIVAHKPNAVFHMIGSNDWANNVPIATYKAQIESRIARFKTQMTTPISHFLIQPYKRLDILDTTALHKWDEYGKALKDIANANSDNVMFIDISKAYEATDYAGADTLDIMAEAIHQGDSGHAFMATLILKALGLFATPDSPEPKVGHTVILDYFNRADAAVPGSALSGQAWEATTGSFGITSGKLIANSGGTCLIESGLKDTDISVIGSMSSLTGVIARANADTDRVGIFLNTTGILETYIRIASVNTIRVYSAARSDLLKADNINELRLRTIGNTIAGYLNGVKLSQYTLNPTEAAALANFTKVGVRHGGGSATWDMFSARSIVY